MAYYAIASKVARIVRRLSANQPARELDIVDNWQGEVARDTRTLSGGESFLVSLALALSDLVSNKTSIDSLFLDEGFDTQTASGKMIGVISHIEGMKERIPSSPG